MPNSKHNKALISAIENNGIPFAVRHGEASSSLREAIADSRNLKNLYGPFSNAEDAVSSMIED